MSYRVYVDTVYGVRPKRGERSYKGRLLKASDAIVQTMEEAQEFIDTMVKHDVPDYCHAIEARVFNWNPNRKYGDSMGEPVKVIKLADA
jgi:hypothetical protein